MKLEIILQIIQIGGFAAMAIGVILSCNNLLSGLKSEVTKLSSSIDRLTSVVNDLVTRVSILEDRAKRE